MRNIWIVTSLIIVSLISQGCTSSRDTTEYTAPNWTSDNKIVFIEDFNHIKERHFFTDETNLEGSYEVLTLCEINNDGSGFIEIGELARSEHHAFSIELAGLSSVGDWVTFSIENEGDSEHSIYIINRNGNNLQRVRDGQNPDFSPDASQIVYEKPNQGIWIMDRVGGNDHQIINEGSGVAWSPDTGRFLYFSDGLIIADTTGNIIDSLGSTRWGADWGHIDSNLVIACDYSIDMGVLIHLTSSVEDTLSFYSGAGFKASPDGEQLTGHDADGWYIININGTNKWYLQP
jgi:hypothetical protein